MNKEKNISLENATGKIDYPLTNDYMFRAVLQENEKVLKGIICSLLHLNPKDVKSVVITNPIILGKHIDDKTFVLDVNVLLNNAQVINLEMQVANQSFWTDRSLSYLCSLFNNLGKSIDYSKVKPACHIGILNFTPFPAYPEFYASNMMTNIKKGYIYNDKFILNVLDLTQIHLATDEDKSHKIDYWAKLFKASTWEELQMLAEKEKVFDEVYNTVFRLNQNEEVRYICEMREEGQRIMRTYKNMLEEDQRIMRTYKSMLEEGQRIIRTYKSVLEEDQRIMRAYKSMLEESQEELARNVATLAEKDSALAEKDSALAEKDSALAESTATLAEKDSALAKQQALIEKLQAELREYKGQ